MSDSLFSSPSYSKICERAARILAVRDHSEQELRRKLAQSPSYHRQQSVPEPPTGEDIENVIAWCYQQNWLDDHKFALGYISGRCRRGYGPLYILQALQQKGVTKEVREDAIAASDINWGEVAKQIAERKFGVPLPEAWPQRVKVQRFLQYRGFFMEDIQHIY